MAIAIWSSGYRSEKAKSMYKIVEAGFWSVAEAQRRSELLARSHSAHGFNKELGHWWYKDENGRTVFLIARGWQ